MPYSRLQLIGTRHFHKLKTVYPILLGDIIESIFLFLKTVDRKRIPPGKYDVTIIQMTLDL